MLVPILVLLTVAPALAAPPRVTYSEGVVLVDRDGVHTLAGRAEAVLPDGTLLHLDVDTDLRVDTQGTISVRNGRVFVRTMPNGAWLTMGLPGAQLSLAPRGDYSILVDGIRARVLVNVGAGDAELRAEGGALRMGPRDAALLMGGRSSVPVPTTYVSLAGDAFVVWSATRLVHMAGGPFDARPGQAGAAYDTPPPYYDSSSAVDPYWGSSAVYGPAYGYPSWPKYGRHGRRPSYAPNYAPDYTPRYGPAEPSGFPSHLGPLPMFPNRLPSSAPPQPPPGHVGRGHHRGPQASSPIELPPRIPPAVAAPQPATTGRSAGVVVNRPGTTRPSSRPAPTSRKPDQQ